MSKYLSQEKICIEKILTHHQDEYNSLYEKSNSHEHHKKLKAAFFTKKLWPKNSTIYIAFIESGDKIPRTSLNSIKNIKNNKGKIIEYDPLQEIVDNMSVEDAIRKIVNERIQPIVGLKLIFTDNIQDANIKIGFEPDGGAWSLIGTDCLQNTEKSTMNFGWFDVATTIHEFGHALGMIHEHQNPDGNKIQWNNEKVHQWAQSTQGWDRETTETNIINKYSTDQINGSKFDSLSIMLYFFPGTLTTNNKGTHENLRLSGYDVLYLNNMYPNSPEDPDFFYKKIYNKSLKKAIEESDNEKNDVKNNNNNKFWIFLLIFILFILFLVIYKKYFKKYYSIISI
jgi:hypothetical protein